MPELSQRIIDHYERHALAWDRDRRGGRFQEAGWLNRFASLFPAGAQVLDLGCGGGDPVARALVELGFKVTGVDSSPTLISLCRARMPEQEWIVGDMRTIDLQRSFDGILAWDSFFHLTPDDQRHVIGVFARHSRGGSALLFNTGPAAGEAIGSYRGDLLYHASLDAAAYETLLAQNDFGILGHVVEDPDAGGRTVWLARRRAG